MLKAFVVNRSSNDCFNKRRHCVALRQVATMFVLFVCTLKLTAQMPVVTTGFKKENGVTVSTKNNQLTVSWPTSATEKGKLVIDLENAKPLFSSIQLVKGTKVNRLMKNADPAFLLTAGKRDLVSQNGWNIFFDKVPLKPHASYVVKLNKKNAEVSSHGNRTIIKD